MDLMSRISQGGEAVEFKASKRAKIMRTLFAVLLGTASLLTITPSFATQGAATGEVRVTADVIDVNYMTLTPVQEMKMPQVYNKTQAQVTSTDQSIVVGGTAGQNALFSVTGLATSSYTVTFNDSGYLYDSHGHQLLIHYSIGVAGSTPTSTSSPAVKTLDINGNDTLAIKGSINFDGLQPVGSYNNYASPMVVTVAIDSI